MKNESIFYKKEYIENIQHNIKKYLWAQETAAGIVKKAEFWFEKTNDEIWELMFGNTIKRASFVWSDGYCPACKASVVMHDWVIDAFRHPWKVQCPKCNSLFPRNDFYSYYRSGIDETGVFRYESADKLLLRVDNDVKPYDNASISEGFINYEDEDSPMYSPEQKEGDAKKCFCDLVDDGDGAMYSMGSGKRWRFIGAYLVFGQWRQLVVGGISSLANAYLVTGDPRYATKAGILIDRVADLFPSFDYRRQGVLYENFSDMGFITTWHDQNVEIKTVILAYDAIFDAIKDDSELVSFLSGKAEKHGLKNKKKTFVDIQNNIEERLLKEICRNPRKVHLNFPGTEVLLVLIKMILDKENYNYEINQNIRYIVDKATACDGTTGEKGMAAYSAFTVDLVLQLLEMLCLANQEQFKNIITTTPNIEKAFCFYTDLFFQNKYYPLIGDTNYFGSEIAFLGNMDFITRPSTSVAYIGGTVGFNLFTLMWRLYKATNNELYLKIARRKSVDTKIVCDIGMSGYDDFMKALSILPDGNNIAFCNKSINYQKWHLAALRSGVKDTERAIWIHYHGTHNMNHGHQDAMNIGLYSKGLDLMPDFGYPPVQYGGWVTKHMRWYSRTLAHNTVTVDRAASDDDAEKPLGKTLLWRDEEAVKVIRVSADGYKGAKRFDRTICMVDIDKQDSFIIDIFRVQGGKEHIKATHSTFGDIAVEGLSGNDSLEFSDDLFIKDVSGSSCAAPGWSADWSVEDKYKLLPAKRNIHLKYIDLTENTAAFTAKEWINAGPTSEKMEEWINVLLTCRRSQSDSLDSTFVSVLVPYEDKCKVCSAKIIPLYNFDGTPRPEWDRAIEIILVDGDTFIVASIDDDKAEAIVDYNDNSVVIKQGFCVLNNREVL